MKITVLNGSPKGEKSISLQYLLYMKSFTPDITYELFHIGAKESVLENNKSEYEKVINSISSSDGVIWVFPVYHFLVPAQVKRFIELIYERGSEEVFKDKYTSCIASSVRFYDTLAENYIHAVSEDLGMKYIRGFLTEMHDLNTPSCQNQLKYYAKSFIADIKNKKEVTKYFAQNHIIPPKYYPTMVSLKSDIKEKKALIITDYSSEQPNVYAMIETFQNSLIEPLEVINLAKLQTKGGCLGCIRCGYNGECVYKDEMSQFLSEKFVNADALIFASAITDRYMTSQMKRMWDRSFMHGHRPIYKNKKFLYLISGQLSNNPVLREEIMARTSVNGVYLVDIISDESGDSHKITKNIQEGAAKLASALRENAEAGENFYSVSGHKIFRDFIYLFRFVFGADHKYYKKIGYYDFPQKRVGFRIINTIVPLLLKIKPFRTEFMKRSSPTIKLKL